MIRCFAILCLFLTACAPAKAPLTGTIVCFGDSITLGQGAAAEESYPYRLAQLLNCEVVNAGVSGDTTADALERVTRDVLSKRPFLVVVELGGNDYLRGMVRRYTLYNLEAIVTKIKKSGAKVFLCDIASSLALGEYRGVYEDLCRRTGAVFIPDVMQGVLDDDSKKSDEIHPNAAGYEMIAQRVADCLGKYYKFGE